MGDPTVLVIDNNAVACEMVQRTLQKEGIRVIVQHDALEALTSLSEEKSGIQKGVYSYMVPTNSTHFCDVEPLWKECEN